MVSVAVLPHQMLVYPEDLTACLNLCLNPWTEAFQIESGFSYHTCPPQIGVPCHPKPKPSLQLSRKFSVTSTTKLRVNTMAWPKEFQPGPKPVFSCEERLCSVAQLCLNLCNSNNRSLPGFSVHGIFQARTLEWVVVSFCKSWEAGSSSDSKRVVTVLFKNLFIFKSYWSIVIYNVLVSGI